MKIFKISLGRKDVDGDIEHLSKSVYVFASGLADAARAAIEAALDVNKPNIVITGVSEVPANTLIISKSMLKYKQVLKGWATTGEDLIVKID